MKNKILIIGLLIVFCLPLLFGIFHKGFFVSDDGNWMVIRLSSFYEALSSGQFPVRLLPRLNQGLGYPVADFLYPLFLYIGSAIHFLKIPFLLDIKLLFFLSMAASLGGMYLFLRKNFTVLSSLIGAIIYLYLPYHVYDMYIRGSLGEVLALALVPFLLWAIEKKSVTLSSIFLGLLILSHNTLALFFLPFVLIYAFIVNRSVKQIILFVVLGLGCASFFWLPALFDKQYTVFDSVAVSNPFSYFVNAISYGLVGWIGLAIFGGVCFVPSFFKEKKGIYFLVVGLIALFFSFSLSSSLWHIKLLATFVQFPFRFLSLVLLSESFLGAYLVEKIKNKILVSIFLLILLLFSSWMYLFPKAYAYQDETFYDTNTGTTTVQNEYMPQWVHHLPTTYAYQKVFISSNAGNITSMIQKGTHITFTVTMKNNATLIITFIYFPGWQATIDGKPVSLSPSSPDGLIQLPVQQGRHTISVWFGETPIRIISDILSLLSLTGIVMLFLKKQYEK